MRSRFQFRLACPAAALTNEAEVQFYATLTGSRPSTPDADLGPSLNRAVIQFHLAKDTSEGAAPDHLSLLITIPGEPEERQLLARQLASDFAEHLALFYPGVRPLPGLLVAERIPDTPEEQTAIAAGPFWAKLLLEEVTPPATLDPEVLRLFPYARDLIVPITQLNQSARASGPIDAFLSAVKVLEYLYHRGRGPFSQSLVGSSELRAAVAARVHRLREGAPPELLSPAETDTLLNDIAAARNQCAHLRDSGAYGYHLRHPELATSLAPLVPIVTGLAQHVLQARLVAARAASQAARAPSKGPGA